MTSTTISRPTVRTSLVPAFILAGLGAALFLVIREEPGLHRGLLAAGLLTALAVMAAYDSATLRVPNVLTYSALALALCGAATLGVDALRDAALGGLASFAILLVVALLGRGAMGFADVKVGAYCGLVVGLGGVLPMVLLSFTAGAFVAGLMLALRLREPKDQVAFVPFLFIGTAFVLLSSRAYLL